MRQSLHKKFVLPALLAGTILGSGIAAHAASVEPRGGWAVTKVEDSKVGGGAYCTLGRQYENNVIISIGRNVAEEYSLAIDFQADKLTVDKSYPLLLKAGNQTRSLDLMPATPRAMVVRLGWDDSFFAALEKNALLTVTLDGQTYEFAFSDFARGQADLTSCMNGLKSAAGDKGVTGGNDVLAADTGAASGFAASKIAEGAPDADAPRPPSARPEATRITALDTPAVPQTAAEKASPQPVVPKRSIELVGLQNENEQLRIALAEQRRAYEESMANVGQSNRVAELEEKIRLLEAGGKGTVAPVAAAPAPSAQLSELQKTVAGLTAEKKTLEAKIAELEAAPPAVPAPVVEKVAINEEQQASLAALSEEVSALRNSLAEKDKTIASLERQTKAESKGEDAALATMKEEVVRLRTEKDEALARAEGLQQDVSRLNASLAAKPEAPAVDQASLDKLSRLESEMRRKDGLLASAQERVKGREDEIAKLKQEVSRLQRQDAQDTVATNNTLQKENENLKAQLSAQQGAQKEIADLKAQVAAQQAAQKEVAELKTQVAGLPAMQKEMIDLKAQLAAAQTQLSAAKAAPPPAERISEQDKKALSEIAAREQEIAGLKEQVATLQKDRALASSVTDQLTSVRSENDQLKAQIASLRSEQRRSSAVAAAAPVAAAVAAAPVAAIREVPVPRAPTSSPAPAVAPAAPASPIGAMLSRAGITAQQSGSTFRWQQNGVSGQADVINGSLSAAADQFSAQARSQCNGDFAAIPGNSAANKVSLDVACVSGMGSAAKSALFALQNGQTVRFTFEAGADDMDRAMDARDRLAGAL